MRLSESFFYLLLSSAKSHMVESWMFPPFENVSEIFHVYYASGAKKLCPELSWMSTVDTFSSPSCHSESIKLTMWLLHVELKRKALQLIVWAYFYFFYFFPRFLSDDDERGWPPGALSVPILHSITPLQCSPHIESAELNGEGGSPSTKPSTEPADLWHMPLISQDPGGIHTGPY